MTTSIACIGAHDLQTVTIRQIADRFSVSLRTLRFYEEIGLLQPQRAGSERLYSPRDETRLQIIILGRRFGFSLREIAKLMQDHARKGDEPSGMLCLLDRYTIEQRIDMLTRQRDRIVASLAELTGSVERRSTGEE